MVPAPQGPAVHRTHCSPVPDLARLGGVARGSARPLCASHPPRRHRDARPPHPRLLCSPPPSMPHTACRPEEEGSMRSRLRLTPSRHWASRANASGAASRPTRRKGKPPRSTGDRFVPHSRPRWSCGRWRRVYPRRQTSLAPSRAWCRPEITRTATRRCPARCTRTAPRRWKTGDERRGEWVDRPWDLAAGRHLSGSV